MKQDTILRGKERGLIIDDEELLNEMGQNMLETLGYNVTTQSNSLEALAIFKNFANDFDTVLNDQTMPELNGSDLARKMTGIRPQFDKL